MLSKNICFALANNKNQRENFNTTENQIAICLTLLHRNLPPAITIVNFGTMYLYICALHIQGNFYTNGNTMVSSFVNFDVVGGDFNDSSWKIQPLHTICMYVCSTLFYNCIAATINTLG